MLCCSTLVRGRGWAPSNWMVVCMACYHIHCPSIYFLWVVHVMCCVRCIIFPGKSRAGLAPANVFNQAHPGAWNSLIVVCCCVSSSFFHLLFCIRLIGFLYEYWFYICNFKTEYSFLCGRNYCSLLKPFNNLYLFSSTCTSFWSLVDTIYVS